MLRQGNGEELSHIGRRYKCLISVEDRLVKRLFASLAKHEGVHERGRLVTKKPLAPTKTELSKNPSARSAKLRVIEKICPEQ